jgi:hypothetical protein
VRQGIWVLPAAKIQRIANSKRTQIIDISKAKTRLLLRLRYFKVLDRQWGIVLRERMAGG